MSSRLPRLTVVVLTRDEARNIGACLASLARQRERAFEAVVVDAGSTDGTQGLVRRRARGFPVPLRLVAGGRTLGVGEARNRGVALARAPVVAFLSADAEAEPGWAGAALRAVARADLVFGRQEHAPTGRGVAPAVRGLRYHHFPRDGHDAADPLRLASNVNAAARLALLRALPFGADAASSAVDDLLLARRAARAGYRVAYEPRMLVRHRDVATLRAELRKNLREGLGWGAHARELGLHRGALAWAALLAGCAAAAAAAPWPAGAAALGGALWGPAARRAWRRRGAMPPRAAALGALASPPFDLAFLASYLRGLSRGGGAAGEVAR